jgi:hypothetical protein
MTRSPLTILFMPESAYGPTNNCIGIGNVLRQRGHRVVFAAEASWKGRLEPLGFEEDLVDLASAAEAGDEQDAGQFWKEFIASTAPEFRKPTIEQLETWIKPVWAELIGGARHGLPRSGYHGRVTGDFPGPGNRGPPTWRPGPWRTRRALPSRPRSRRRGAEPGPR